MSDRFDRDEETFVRERMEGVGPRPSLADEDLEAIRNAARHAWRLRWQDRAVSRRRWLLPLAAAIVAAALLASWSATRPRPVTSPELAAASVERLEGTAVAGRTLLEKGDSIPGGTPIETGPGSRVSLRLGRISSLRIDASTLVRIASSDLVELDRGAVYIDSGGGVPVRVRTPAGEIVPVGTRFEARVEDSGTIVRVREGRVRVVQATGSLTLDAREMIEIRADGGVERGIIGADDPRWAWALEVAPMMEIEGRSLREFLEWVARENGWELRFADEEWTGRSETITLHGSVGDLTPHAALDPVMLSTGIDYRIADGVLIVGE